MKLLREIVETTNLITESAPDGTKRYFIEGIFLQGDILNKNGRIYPCSILDPEVERYIEEKVNTKTAYGELNHPTKPSIDLDRVSHLITELHKDKKNWIGKAIIADSTTGKNVKALLDIGSRLGVSSRGLGSLKESNGTNVVQSDFKLMTAADIVSDPSAPDAFVEAIMEDTEWVMTLNGDWVPVAIETYQNKIKKTSSKNLMEEKIKIFADFLKKL